MKHFRNELLKVFFLHPQFSNEVLDSIHLHINFIIWYLELIVGNPGAIHIGLNGLGPFNWLGKKYVLQHVRWEGTNGYLQSDD